MRSHGPRRLAVSVVALAALAYMLAHADRLPGHAGEMIWANVETDRDATALFFTEVDGWQDWPATRSEAAARGDRNPGD